MISIKKKAVILFLAIFFSFLSVELFVTSRFITLNEKFTTNENVLKQKLALLSLESTIFKIKLTRSATFADDLESIVENISSDKIKNRIRFLKESLKAQNKIGHILNDLYVDIEQELKKIESNSKQSSYKLDLVYENTLMLLLILFLNTVISSFIYIYVRDLKTNIDSFENALKSFFRFFTTDKEPLLQANSTTKDEFSELFNYLNRNMIQIAEDIKENDLILEKIYNTIKSAMKSDFSSKINESSSNEQLQNIIDSCNALSELLQKEQLKHQATLSLAEKLQRDKESLNENDALEKLIKLTSKIGSELNSLNSSLNENIEKTAIADSNFEEIKNSLNNLADEHQRTENIFIEYKGKTKESLQSAELIKRSIEAANLLFNDFDTIVEEINKIMFQINILSLNATIESSALGESANAITTIAEDIRVLVEKNSQILKSLTSISKESIASCEMSKDEAENIEYKLKSLESSINHFESAQTQIDQKAIALHVEQLKSINDEFKSTLSQECKRLNDSVLLLNDIKSK